MRPPGLARGVQIHGTARATRRISLDPSPDLVNLMKTSIDQRIEFAARFVDAVTIKPFFADLQRMKRDAHLFPRMPSETTHEGPATPVRAA